MAEDSENDHDDKESASKRPPAKHGNRFNDISVMHFPDNLILTESDDYGAPTTDQIVDATKKAVDHPDVQTIFFVDFRPSSLDAEGTKELKKLVGMVQSWQAWSSSVCEGTVMQQIDRKTLPDTVDGQFARSTYRAKVFAYLLRQATWFQKTFDQGMTKHIEVQKVEFHTAILETILQGFAVPQTTYIQLEKILATIGDNIMASRTKTRDKQQYWLMLTRYEWQPEVQAVRPVIRAIDFSIDPKMSDYIAGKLQYTSISIDIVFGQYQADFVAKIWMAVSKGVDDKLVKAGMDLVTQKSTVVPI